MRPGGATRGCDQGPELVTGCDHGSALYLRGWLAAPYLIEFIAHSAETGLQHGKRAGPRGWCTEHESDVPCPAICIWNSFHLRAWGVGEVS